MTVAKEAEACLESFRKCLEHSAAVHSRELSLIEDQLARLYLWIGNIRVFGPSRESLDHRLREAPEVQNTVASLLQALTYYVNKCSSILGSLKPPDPHQPIPALDEYLENTIREAADQISLLNKLSNTIRRASKTTQNIQAASSFQIIDDEGNDAAGFLHTVFAQYVGDRFPGISEKIQQRLAATMVLRWKRVLYRRERYGKGSVRVEHIPSKPAVVAPQREATAPASQHPVSVGEKRIGPQRQSVPKSLTKGATTLIADEFKKAAALSEVSATKTVSLGSHEELRFPPAPLGAIIVKAQQICQQATSDDDFRWKTVRDARQAAIWPDAVAAVGEVTCPFCFYALPAEDVTDEMKWMMHVKSDLDAYVCLFDECDCPNDLYTHTSQWLKHMRAHALRWKCKSHLDFVGTTREEFIEHFQREHNSKLSEAQLHVLADRSGRATGPLFKTCALCGTEEVKDSMVDHIVGHLRSLALKSLPGYEDVGGEDVQGLYTQSSAAQSRGTTRMVEQSTSTSPVEERHSDSLDKGKSKSATASNPPEKVASDTTAPSLQPANALSHGLSSLGTSNLPWSHGKGKGKGTAAEAEAAAEAAAEADEAASQYTATSSAPSAYSERTDVNNTIHRQRPPIERYQLPCEFSKLTSCTRVFAGDDVEGWMDHVEGHLQSRFPTKLKCWFCYEYSFDAKETSGGDVRSNFITRMQHIRDHICFDGCRFEQMQIDGHLVRHLNDQGLIDKQTYEEIITPRNVPRLP